MASSCWNGKLVRALPARQVRPSRLTATLIIVSFLLLGLSLPCSRRLNANNNAEETFGPLLGHRPAGNYATRSSQSNTRSSDGRRHYHVGVSFSGGGFRAMTTAMAFARAFANAEVLEDITHLASTSGGSWFSGQFLYSKSFYDAVTDSKEEIGQVIQDWFDDAYTNRNAELTTVKSADPNAVVVPSLLTAADDAEASYHWLMGNLTANDPRLLDELRMAGLVETTSEGLPSWDDVAAFLQRILAALERVPGDSGDLAGMAALAPQFEHWLRYVRRLLVRPGLSDMELTFATANRTLPRPSFIAAVCLPASTWFTNLDKDFAFSAESVTIDPIPQSGSSTASEQTVDLQRKGSVMPAAFCSPGSAANTTAGTGGWLINPNVERLELKLHSDDAFASPLDGSDDDAATLTLPSDPSLSTLLAGSSAAGGLLSDPHQLLQLSDNLVQSGVLPCWASGVPALIRGLQPLLARYFVGAGVNAYGIDFDTNSETTDPTKPDWTRQLQLLDGGYADNTAAASLIARMQQDSQRGSETALLRAVIVDGSAGSEATRGNGSLELASLFKFGSDSSPPGWIIPSTLTYNATYRPKKQIFREAYPEKDNEGWSDYAVADVKSGVPSRVWTGTVTTVQNDWYAVQGGWEVELMVFAVNTDLRTIISPDNLKDAVLTAPYIRQNNAQVEGLDKMAAALARFMGRPQ